MNKILKDSLIRKNRHLYTNALRAVENIMPQEFQATEQFKKIRSVILTVGNEIGRSIETELDQYAIVMLDGDAPTQICASEYIKSLLPQVKFTTKVGTEGSLPIVTIVAREDADDLSLLREILECGAVSRVQGRSVCEVIGVRDCLRILPIFERFMNKLPNNNSYHKWVTAVLDGYRCGQV
jgi:hypothetical protein